jgi:hypothetical protein
VFPPPMVQGGRYTLAIGGEGMGGGGPLPTKGQKLLYSRNICSLPLYIEKVLEGAWLKLFSLVASRVTASLRKGEWRLNFQGWRNERALVKKKRKFSSYIREF